MKIKFIVSALEMVSCGNGYKETDDDFLFLFFFFFFFRLGGVSPV